MGSKLKLIFSAALVVAMFCITGVASANSQVTQMQFSEAPFTNTSTNVAVSTSTGKGKIVVLFDEHFSAEIHSPKCHWTDGWNSGENANGTLYWFWDTHMYVCPSKTSPTGWAKVKGGMTGRDCGNAVKLKQKPQHNVVARSRVKLLPHLVVEAVVHVSAKASVIGSAIAKCEEGGAFAAASLNASGEAIATAEGKATASSKSKAIAKATAEANFKLVTKEKASAYATARAEATSKIEGQVAAKCHGSPPKMPSCEELGTCCKETHTCSCEETHTCCKETHTCNCEEEHKCSCKENHTCSCEEEHTCPPPEHFTEISCRGFEEISGGESFLVDCDVNNDNGAPISLKANSNDGNSRVSGISCISNGGSPSCPGKGTFEFRVTGINKGPTILSSSVTAIATSNGIPASWNSGSFPVDPEEGGF